MIELTERLESIRKRVELQGILTLADLNSLEDAGINLTKFISWDDVSHGKVNYDKFMSALAAYKQGLGLKSPSEEHVKQFKKAEDYFKRHYMCTFVGD